MVCRRVRNGDVPAASIDDIPESYRSLFQPKGSRGTALVISDELKALISFRHLNLMKHPWPMRGLFDAIFCRNVMIYFEVDTKKAILGRLARVLRPDGYLLLGGAETTFNLDDSYRRVAPLKSGFYQLAR